MDGNGTELWSQNRQPSNTFTAMKLIFWFLILAVGSIRFTEADVKDKFIKFVLDACGLAKCKLNNDSKKVFYVWFSVWFLCSVLDKLIIPSCCGDDLGRCCSRLSETGVIVVGSVFGTIGLIIIIIIIVVILKCCCSLCWRSFDRSKMCGVPF